MAGGQSILDKIGNTPLVALERVNNNPRVQVFVKLEGCNPGGSVKDRTAKSLIMEAVKSGEFTPDKTVIEPTSGNTGIGMAMICAIKGYKLLLVMSESVSLERRKILAAYGAKFILTPGDEGTDGAIEVAYNMVNEAPENYYLPDQYNNPANPLVHYNTTGKEIWEQTQGKVTHFVSTIGTCGTIVGVSRRLKEYNPDIKIIAGEPVIGHKIQGLKSLKEAYVPGIWNKGAVDEKQIIEDKDAFETARRLAKEEGILCGMSSGGAVWLALKKAREIESGLIVAILPDGGERYLSTPLFKLEQDPS